MAKPIGPTEGLEPGWRLMADAMTVPVQNTAGAGFGIKDSGQRHEFPSGMVRDVVGDKTDYTYLLSGPMLDRWARHLMNGAKKYSRDNWLKANGPEELERARASAMRHLIQWLRGDEDEDHAAAVFFNVNLAEYVRGRMASGG